MMVSVIIPNYNHGKFLRQRIESVLDQTFKDFEVIILDDCSTDESRVLIESYRGNSQISVIAYNEVNSGSPFKQWQKGVALARGEYVWIAESDDYADRRFLEHLVALVKANPNIGIAFCDSNWVDDEGRPGRKLSVYQESFVRTGLAEIKGLLRRNSIQNASSAILKRDLTLRHVSKITSLKACGDWFLYILILQDSDICYTQEVLNNYRWYRDNTSNKAMTNGVWLLEGAAILAALDLTEASIDKTTARGIYVHWIKRILKSPRLKFTSKWRSIVHCTKFYIHYARS
jgi:glycosyltransferase involved in cell wall biosynthesis